MISSAVRRSALLASRRLTATPAAASLSTQATQLVYHVEDLLMGMRWAHLKDNIEEILQLMNEPKTNHSLHVDPDLENQVTEEICCIQDLVTESSAPDLALLEARISGLKKHVRSQLYQLG